MRSPRSFRSSHAPLSCACLVLLLLVSVSFSVSAQTVVGRISGTVKDTSGAVIPGATVTVTNAAFGTLTAAGPARNIQFGLKLTF